MQPHSKIWHDYSNTCCAWHRMARARKHGWHDPGTLIPRWPMDIAYRFCRTSEVANDVGQLDSGGVCDRDRRPSGWCSDLNGFGLPPLSDFPESAIEIVVHCPFYSPMDSLNLIFSQENPSQNGVSNHTLPSTYRMVPLNYKLVYKPH